jgi:hypothetical protein
VGFSLTCSFLLISCSEIAYKQISTVKTAVSSEAKINIDEIKIQKQTVIARIRSPEEILKQTIVKVEELLGKPSFKRSEGDVVVFQYGQDWCIFDVVFYGEGKSKTASYYEFRTTDGRGLNILECLQKVIVNKGLK